MTEAILLQPVKSNRYVGWVEREYEGTSYLLSPKDLRIAYELDGKYVELTWRRSVGKVGPNQGQSMEDYVGKRLRWQADKRDVKNIATVLTSLEVQYGRRGV